MNENESKSVVKDEGTSGARSEWVGSWWQLIALMSVSAVMVTGIIVIGREMELKKEYVQASESTKAERHRFVSELTLIFIRGMDAPDAPATP